MINDEITARFFLFSLASYPEMLAYLHQPDHNNRRALQANSYEQFYAHVAPFTTPFMSMLLLSSTYLTVLVSGDRYFLICWPSIAEKIRTRTVSLRLVLLVFVVINIYIIPHWFEYKTAYVDDKNKTLNLSTSFLGSPTTTKGQTGKRLAEITFGPIGSYKMYQKIYRLYLNIPITFFIPFILLTFCNGSMIYKLLLIRKQKKRLGRRMKADIQITTMLIVIVLMFMLCRSFNLLANMMVQFFHCLNKNSLHRQNAWANLLVAFNGFVNFFLFAAFGQRFREMVLTIFFRRGRYGVFSPIDGGSTHRAGPVGTLATGDLSRRTSRLPSGVDSELWAAIARRRSSATMAVFSNHLENNSRISTDKMVQSSNAKDSVHINGFKESPTNPIDANNESTHQASRRSSLGNTLLVPGDGSIASKVPSPSSMKKKSNDETPTTAHRVKFV